MAFDPKNTAHKAQLHPVIIAVAELTDLRYDDVLDLPFDQPWARSPDYKRNIRSGQFSQVRAKAIYDWLQDHHFVTAHKHAAEIFPHTPAMRWRTMLDERALPDTLKIVPMASSFGLVKLESQTNEADVQLKLGQRFCLDLSSDIDGYVIILQGLGDMWYPVQLADDGSYETAVTAGSNLLPRFPDGTPHPLHEDTHEGLHSFVIVTATEPNIPVAIDRLITWVNDHEARLHRVTAEIVR